MTGPAGRAGTLARGAGRAWRGLLLGGLIALAPTVAADAAQAPVGSEPVARSGAEVRDYWTAERMSSARPARRVVDRLGDVVRSLGAPRAAPSAGPSAQAVEVTDNRSAPERTHGKVFFTFPGQGNFVCSGTAVRSRAHNVVLTAGHCLYDELTGEFATNWMFVPGYRDGQRPFGEWPAARLATTKQYRHGGDLRFDVGIAVVRRDGNGRGIEDRVGARRIAFDPPRDRFYRAFGYPARSPFNGQRLYRCDSDYQGEDLEFRPPRPSRIDCEMTGGASGGGWLAGGAVNSLTSYAYECTPILILPCQNDEAGRLFGPYFGSAVRKLYRANRGRARRCGGAAASHRGGGADDVLRGTAGRDVIHGGSGNDSLRARAGDDVVCGGQGRDRLVPGPGRTRVFAGPGHDRVIATGGGRGRIAALRGRNLVRCGPGRQVVITNHTSRTAGPCEVVRRR